MAIRAMPERLARFFRVVYLKLFRINDTPQKIALGAGLGVFCGVLPGAGPIAAIGLAFLFRANRAAALLGSLLTNTWISIPVFLASIKAGALVTGARYQDLRADWGLLMKDFHWRALLDAGAQKVLVPIIIGYAAVAVAIAFAAYTAALIVVQYGRRKLKK